MTNTQTVVVIMNEPVVTLQGEDNLRKVRDTFKTHQTHYIPILRGDEFMGIIHKSDFDFFIAGLLHHGDDFEIDSIRLQRTHAQDVMTTSEDTIPPDTTIQTALDILVEHHFQALPVVQDRTLLGVVTPYDLLQQIQHASTVVEAG